MIRQRLAWTMASYSLSTHSILVSRARLPLYYGRLEALLHKDGRWTYPGHIARLRNLAP
jgi:hypothetical protein